MSNEVGTPNDTTSDDLVGIARLLQHVKENNVTWMVAAMFAYQIGVLDRFLAYGSGMC